MAFSDARNERDRAETGKNSGNHGGEAKARDAERRNREAMARNAAPSRYDSRTMNPRYNQNLIASGPMTMHNMMELAKMTPGPGMAMKAALGAAGFTGPLGGPSFEGVTNRSATGFSYDGPNRFATNGSALFPTQQGIQGVRAAGAPKPAAPTMPGMSPLQMPAAQLNVPGPSQYGVTLPSYGYFGQPPALQRPKSAIMGGI